MPKPKSPPCTVRADAAPRRSSTPTVVPGPRAGMRLWVCALAATLALLGMVAPTTRGEPVQDDPSQTTPSSKLFYVLESHVVGEGKQPNAALVASMVASLVKEVTGKPDLAEAWQSLLKPTDIVGIKVSTGAGPIGGTREAVAKAVAAGLREAGFPRERILIWDRNREDLLGNGFREDDPDYVLRWVDPKDGYNLNAKVSAPVLGRLIWGDGLFGRTESIRFADMLSSGDQLSSQSHYTKILSEEVTAVINIPSATDSFLTGINGAFANMTISNIDNWRRFTKPPDHGNPYIAEIYADELVGGKVVLTLLDALIVQYAGGPFPNPGFTVDNGTLFASTDPVAIDATLVAMVDEVRKASKLPPIKSMTGYLDSARALELGTNLPEQIETIRAGVGDFQ